MHGVAAYPVREVPRFAFNAPWAEGFDGDVFMRTVGLVILVTVGILYLLSCLFNCLGIGANQPPHYAPRINADEPRQPAARVRLAIRRPAGDGVVNRPTNIRPVSEAARRKDEEAVRAAEAATQGLVINQREISAAPPLIVDIIAQLPDDISQVKVDEILDCYDEVFNLRAAMRFVDAYIQRNHINYNELPSWGQINARNVAHGAYYKKYGRANAEQLALRESLRTRYVEFIKRRIGSDGAAYFDRMELVAKHIICQIRKPTTPLHKKEVALSQIADAANGGCEPRRLEESQRQLLSLLGRTLTVRDRCLLFAQALKDDILLQHFQGVDNFHVINRMRRHIGIEWGLSQDPLSLNDPHAKDGGSYAGNATPDQMRAVLRANYTAPRLASAIHTRLAYDNDLRELCDFLNEKLSDADKENILNFEKPEEGYTMATTMQIEGRPQHISIVTLKGVAKITQMVGLLTPEGS